MKIKALYEKYDIMPQLAEHQLRVGGIAKIITDPWYGKQSARESVLACLVHDMGNIVKFKNLTDPVWLEVKQIYVERYGHDPHVATKGILDEAGLNFYSQIMEEESQIYQQAQLNPDFNLLSRPALMILYCDLRVAMTGVVTLPERVKDLQDRYPDEKRIEGSWSDRLESYIQSLTTAKITTITERDVRPLFAQLLEYEI